MVFPFGTFPDFNTGCREKELAVCHHFKGNDIGSIAVNYWPKTPPDLCPSVRMEIRLG
jgi:hypothetical protein